MLVNNIHLIEYYEHVFRNKIRLLIQKFLELCYI